MIRDEDRVARVREALKESGLDALVCTLPHNVLMLTGYWPVTGRSVAVFTHDAIYIICPSDEERLARDGWSDEVVCFQAASMQHPISLLDAVSGPLSNVIRQAGLGRCAIGIESGFTSLPVPYAAVHLYGSEIQHVISSGTCVSLQLWDAWLSRLRSVLTADETARLRRACALAEQAFCKGKGCIKPAINEAEVALRFRGPLMLPAEGTHRNDGFTFCMSGPNGANAKAAFQLSTGRRLTAGDLALVHCNSYADGFWTDISRTYSVGDETSHSRHIFTALRKASEAALDRIRPGVTAAEVDAAARHVMVKEGLGETFVHGLGHGVGFQAIDHAAPPRLQPGSVDVLEEGMVFNVEPGAYKDEEWGARHCDMVAVTSTGHELLTAGVP